MNIIYNQFIMEPTYHYTTVLEALNDLKEKGFTLDFNINKENILRDPHEFEVKHVYRYEGDTDPGEEATVYGIESNSGEKGVFVSGYSANSNDEVDQILHNIRIQ